MKKAQIQMGETITILIIFIILIMFGLAVYVSFQKSSFEEKKTEQEGLLATELAIRVLYLPELQCTISGVSEHNCIDLSKLVAFSNQDMNTKIYNNYDKSSLTPIWNPEGMIDLMYFDIFKYANITFKMLDNPDEKIIIYEQTIDREQADTIKTFFPVSTYNPLAEDGKKYSIGEIEVEYFRKISR